MATNNNTQKKFNKFRYAYGQIYRGYLEGHKYLTPSSVSNVIEQVVRILIVIFGSFVSIKIYKSSIPIGVSVALSGTFFGGLLAYIYLRR